MRVSVVLATYNGAKYIVRQLESLAQQTHQPFELIVSDDASKDDTVALVEEFAATAPFPVKVRSNEKALGYAENFLSACEMAEGELISLCDQDDVWLPEKLATAVQRFEKYPKADMVITSAAVVDSDLNPLGANHPRIVKAGYQPPRSMSPFARPPGFCMVMRRRLVTEFDWRKRPLDLDFSSGMSKHDTWLLTLANCLGGVYLDPTVCALYRRHGSNHSFMRSGTNLTRRLGQWRDMFRRPDLSKLEHGLEALESHAAYFAAKAQFSAGELKAEMEQAASLYEDYAEGHRERLALAKRSPLRKGRALVSNLSRGRYGGLGRGFQRRLFAEDAIAVILPPLRSRN